MKLRKILGVFLSLFLIPRFDVRADTLQKLRSMYNEIRTKIIKLEEKLEENDNLPIDRRIKTTSKETSNSRVATRTKILKVDLSSKFVNLENELSKLTCKCRKFIKKIGNKIKAFSSKTDTLQKLRSMVNELETKIMKLKEVLRKNNISCVYKKTKRIVVETGDSRTKIRRGKLKFDTIKFVDLENKLSELISKCSKIVAIAEQKIRTLEVNTDGVGKPKDNTEILEKKILEFPKSDKLNAPASQATPASASQAAPASASQAAPASASQAAPASASQAATPNRSNVSTQAEPTAKKISKNNNKIRNAKGKGATDVVPKTTSNSNFFEILAGSSMIAVLSSILFMKKLRKRK